MARKAATHPVFKAVMKMAAEGRAKAGASDLNAVWTHVVDEDWGVAVNCTDQQKRVQFGTLNIGVVIPAQGIAVWHRGWLVAVIMEAGGTFLPIDSGLSLMSLIDAIAAPVKR